MNIRKPNVSFYAETSSIVEESSNTFNNIGASARVEPVPHAISQVRFSSRIDGNSTESLRNSSRENLVVLGRSGSCDELHQGVPREIIVRLSDSDQESCATCLSEEFEEEELDLWGEGVEDRVSRVASNSCRNTQHDFEESIDSGYASDGESDARSDDSANQTRSRLTSTVNSVELRRRQHVESGCRQDRIRSDSAVRREFVVRFQDYQVKRGFEFEDLVDLIQRSPTKLDRIQYLNETGLDHGALKKESTANAAEQALDRFFHKSIGDPDLYALYERPEDGVKDWMFQDLKGLGMIFAYASMQPVTLTKRIPIDFVATIAAIINEFPDVDEEERLDALSELMQKPSFLVALFKIAVPDHFELFTKRFESMDLSTVESIDEFKQEVAKREPLETEASMTDLVKDMQQYVVGKFGLVLEDGKVKLTEKTSLSKLWAMASGFQFVYKAMVREDDQVVPLNDVMHLYTRICGDVDLLYSLTTQDKEGALLEIESERDSDGNYPLSDSERDAFYEVVRSWAEQVREPEREKFYKLMSGSPQPDVTGGFSSAKIKLIVHDNRYVAETPARSDGVDSVSDEAFDNQNNIFQHIQFEARTCFKYAYISKSIVSQFIHPDKTMDERITAFSTFVNNTYAAEGFDMQ